MLKIRIRIYSIVLLKKEKLIENKCMISKVMAIEKCKTEEELKETLEELINTTKEGKNKEKIGRIIQYILSPIIGKEKAEILLNKLKEGEKSMTGMLETNLRKERMKLIAESEKRGEERGERRGERRGDQNNKIKIIKQMLNHDESINKIKLYTNATEEEIEKIKDELAST